MRRSPLGCPNVRKNRKTEHSNQMNQHSNLSLAGDPLPRSDPKRTTPALHPSPLRLFRRHDDQLKLKAPPIQTNSEQFRPKDTSEKFSLPQNTSPQLSSGGLANLAPSKIMNVLDRSVRTRRQTQNPRRKTENSIPNLHSSPPLDWPAGKGKS